MSCPRRLSLTGAMALLAVLPPVAQAQTTPKVFYACYSALIGVVYRIKEPGLPTHCLLPSHVEFSWTSGGTTVGVTDHGALTGLLDDDHPQYVLVDGSRALTGALSMGGHKLTNLAAASANGEAVRFEQALKSGDAAGGDLSGSTYPDPTVAKLQGTPVSPTAPANGQVLTYDAVNTRWAPATPATSGGGGGISGWERVSSTGEVGSTGAVISVLCPAGKRPLGGGWTVNSHNVPLVLASSPNSDGTGWEVWAASGSDQFTLSITTFAVCANAAP